MPPRARIVLPANYAHGDRRTPDRAYLDDAYVRLVHRAGALPVLAPPLGTFDDDLARAYAPDGVLLSGGYDLSGDLFGQATHPKAHPMAPIRQAAELAWFAWADRNRVPVLGICLGCQVINVARGGTLAQHLPDLPGARNHQFPDTQQVHEVRVVGPTLRAIAGSDRVAVNSRHWQAVAEVGRGLRVAAVADDGVIEAVEDVGDGFVLGVQWHPEHRPDDALTGALLEAFLHAIGA